MVSDKETDTLMDSYVRYFGFARSLEEGIHAFNHALQHLKPEDIDNIREILRCIGHQFDDKLTHDQKEKSMDTMKNDIKILNNTGKGSKIVDIFESLSKVPPAEPQRNRRA